MFFFVIMDYWYLMLTWPSGYNSGASEQISLVVYPWTNHPVAEALHEVVKKEFANYAVPFSWGCEKQWEVVVGGGWVVFRGLNQIELRGFFLFHCSTAVMLDGFSVGQMSNWPHPRLVNVNRCNHFPETQSPSWIWIRHFISSAAPNCFSGPVNSGNFSSISLFCYRNISPCQILQIWIQILLTALHFFLEGAMKCYLLSVCR